MKNNENEKDLIYDEQTLSNADILALMKSHGLTKGDIIKRTGISAKQLEEFINGKPIPSKIISKLCSIFIIN